MRLIGMMPVRNEAHVLGLSARAALRWVDELLILVHASTDGTDRIAKDLTAEFPNRAFVCFNADPKWREMEHRQHLLTGARQRGATHFAIIDADEILTGNLIGCIRGQIEQLRPGHILQLPGYNLRRSLDQFHENGVWGNRYFSVAFRKDDRANWAGDRFHHREAMGVENFPHRPIMHGQGGILHLWGTSVCRLKARHALYKITERLRWPDKPVAEIDALYSMAIHDPGNWRFADVPAEWWEPYADILKHGKSIYDRPWQMDECRRLVAEHGAEYFAGLDLFGIA